MKKEYCKFLIAVVALLLSAAMLLGGCGPTLSEEELNGMQQGEKLNQAYGDDSSVTNLGENAPVVELKPGERPYRSKGKWLSVADGDVVADFKVTSFNVGQWYHGTTNLNVWGAQETVHPGITPERVMNGYNQWMKTFPEYDADLICAQEVNPIFMIDSKKDLTLTSEEVLKDYFKEIHSFEGKTANTRLTMWNAILIPNASGLTLKNVTSGYLCGGDPEIQRLYVKGYVTVKGHDIAIFDVHLQPRNFGGEEGRKQAFAELAELMSKEEYAVAMGDMNVEEGLHEYDLMLSYGYNMANGGVFGSFNTYEYGTTDYIDNIFTTNNIEIVYAESEPGMVGASDHYPMSAYLFVKDEQHTNKNPNSIAEDGYMEGWYKP